MIPVVFTHMGGQPYIEIAIKQAQRWNQRVILLGNEENEHLNVEHYDCSKIPGNGAIEFAWIYQHMSHNPEWMELFCFQIYFLARDFARAQGFDKIFLLDSDVMLYCDVTEEERKLGRYDLAVSWCEDQWKYRLSACLHNSFWPLTTLEMMCEFIMETYEGGEYLPLLKEKWAWHERENIPGGVCDMSLLWLFIQNKRAINLSEVRGGAAWDDNMNIPENYHPDEYRMKDGLKEITWVEDQPYGWNEVYQRPVRFNALHFQGGAKRKMGEYVR